VTVPHSKKLATHNAADIISPNVVIIAALEDEELGYHESQSSLPKTRLW
jgi:hypothetical protein